MNDEFCICGQGLIEVFNTTLFQDCYYCPYCDEVYILKITKVPKSYFKKVFTSDRFNDIKRFALIKQAKKRITYDDLVKLGYLK